MGFFDFLKGMFKVQGSAGTYTSGKDRPLDDPEKEIDMANNDMNEDDNTTDVD
jgi:hypothetical protein